MFRHIITVSAAALSISIAAGLLAVAAMAQDSKAFSGRCTDYAKDRPTCEGTGWCRFTDRKAVTLPDGKTVQPLATCAFKPGLKKVAQQG